MGKEEGERYKNEGNELFKAKKYDEAIEAYTKSMEADPSNAVPYSNRSACWAAKGDWNKAFNDASDCLKKDPTFIKGYFRLGVAHMELGQFDDALAILSRAKDMENGTNEMINKTIQNVMARKTNARKRSNKKLDESQKKEFLELQQQAGNLQRDIRMVSGRLNAIERETKMSQTTSSYISEQPDDINLFRSVGKGFFYQTKQDTISKLDSVVASLAKQHTESNDRKQYLEHRLASTEKNMKDILDIP